MNARISMLLAVVAAVVLLGSGCGDDDSTGGSADNGRTAGGSEVALTTSSLSKPEYVKRAKAVCDRARKDLPSKASAYIQRYFKKKPEPVVIAGMIKTVALPPLEKELTQLEGLGAPEGDEEEIAEVLSAERKAVEEVKKLDRIESNEAFESYFRDASKQLREYGLEACAHSL